MNLDLSPLIGNKGMTTPTSVGNLSSNKSIQPTPITKMTQPTQPKLDISPLVKFGARVQEVIGGTGDTFGQRVAGVATKIKETLPKIGQKITEFLTPINEIESDAQIIYSQLSKEGVSEDVIKDKINEMANKKYAEYGIFPTPTKDNSNITFKDSSVLFKQPLLIDPFMIGGISEKFGNKLIKTIAESKNTKIVINALKDLNIKNITDSLVNKLTKTKSVNEIESILGKHQPMVLESIARKTEIGIKNALDTSALKQIKPAVKPVIKPLIKPLAKTAEPLIQDIKKLNIDIPKKNIDIIGDYKIRKIDGEFISDVRNIKPEQVRGGQFFVDNKIVEQKMLDIKLGRPIKPIVIKEGGVIDGYHTAEALSRLGFKELPAVFIEIKGFPLNSLKFPKLEQIIEPQRLPAVITGKTFTLGESKTIQPIVKELRAQLKSEIKATQKEIRNAEIAQKKAMKLDAKQQKVREEAIQKINTRDGNTDVIISSLKDKHLSAEDIDNIVLEDGTKLVDTVKVKRNKDNSLAAVILKDDIDALRTGYTSTTPREKFVKVNILGKSVELTKGVAGGYELPAVFFERKGLEKIYEPIIEAGRASEVLKNSFIKRFKDAGLFKNQGWFTADRFNLSAKEAGGVGKYYLTRQGKGYKVALEDLSENGQKFVKIFDDIIKETEPRFYEIAKKNGRNPGIVENYAPIMTREDLKIADKLGAMDFITRKHPSFSALKERAKYVPVEVYETDYRKIASRWLEGMSQYLNIGEVTPEIKFLIDSDQFKGIVNNQDYSVINKWFRDIVNPQLPDTFADEAVDSMSRLLRRTTAIASLGLNYASVVKQALTQIPVMLIERALPKTKSQYAKAFGINVADLPSVTKRAGDIAIGDLQEGLARIFTGPLTAFDRKNAQLSLNGLLDKEYYKILKQGAEITPEIQKFIEKTAQDKLDMWYGGFFKGQRPEFFRSSTGQFLNMFIYPLTSQLNGFYRQILKSKGLGNKAVATAEVMAAATTIAYMEQAISNLSLEWSDEKQMTGDVLQSLLGNIPVLSQISYALMNDQDLQISAGISGVIDLVKKSSGYIKGTKDLKDLIFSGAELVGLPKQFRRIGEGLEIIEEGGITNKEREMLAPVKEVDEILRSVLRGKYGSQAAKDWVRNIGEKKEDRRWFVPQVEFLQNGDYDRKAELYRSFTEEEQEELRNFLSDAQQKKLDSALSKKSSGRKSIEDILSGGSTNKVGRKSIEEILKK